MNVRVNFVVRWMSAMLAAQVAAAALCVPVAAIFYEDIRREAGLGSGFEIIAALPSSLLFSLLVMGPQFLKFAIAPAVIIFGLMEAANAPRRPAIYSLAASAGGMVGSVIYTAQDLNKPLIAIPLKTFMNPENGLVVLAIVGGVGGFVFGALRERFMAKRATPQSRSGVTTRSTAAGD
jgi:hypothetical protein